MNIIRFQGGFGNQLFQYALAMGIKAKTGQDYLFDKTGLGIAKGVTPWPYMLECMALDVPLCSLEQSRIFQQEKASPLIAKTKKAVGVKIPKFVREVPNRVNEEIWNISGDAYFDGYWQSEKYFKHIENEVRAAFRLKNPLCAAASAFAKQMDIPNSVSLHIRRGDYVEFKKVSEILGVCGPDYFNRALETLVKKVPNPHLFIFSDDIEWAKTDLPLPHETTYVSGGDTTWYEEMFLISHCKHNILSNSSFSWWGAWLNPNPDKIIIGPKPWFRDPKIENPDIAPPSWIRV